MRERITDLELIKFLEEESENYQAIISVLEGIDTVPSGSIDEGIRLSDLFKESANRLKEYSQKPNKTN